ncbi:MAG TPA: hypothetical protein VJT73_02905, partial [Polyangiaceae bacterium]|nr:hypothetical protein [Polyangiaceae bacterium]
MNRDESEARRRGRRIVMTAYYLVVVAFILLAAGNVTWQVWAPAFRSYDAAIAAKGDAPAMCRTGLAQLARAIERARRAASSRPEADEDVVLAQFRSALAPEWDEHDAIAAACQTNRNLAVALDVIERLRYAE